MQIKESTIDALKKETPEDNKVDIKRLKKDIDDMRKDKNALYVAFKRSKKELKEQQKEFDKKKLVFEKTITELTEYRRTKLAEERELKLKRRKELKKAKQKAKHLETQTDLDNLDDVNKIVMGNSEPKERKSIEKMFFSVTVVKALKWLMRMMHLRKHLWKV